MKDNLYKDIELRSEDFQEILGSVPPWIQRWGIIAIAIIVVLLLIGSIVFKYPDVISSTITLTGTSPATSVVSKTSGKIQEMYVKDNQFILKDNYLAIIENPAKTEDIKYLKEYLRFLSTKLDSIQSLPPKNLSLGDLQGLYSSLYISLSEYQQLIGLGYYLRKIDFMREKITQTKLSHQNLLRQKVIIQEQLSLTQKQYSRDSVLNKKGVIANEELEEAYNQSLQNYLSFENINASLENLQLQILQTEESLFDTEYQYHDKKHTLETQIKSFISQLMSEIQVWELSYALAAPIDGNITFSKYWTLNQNVTAGETVFNIVPIQSGELIGKALLPTERSGKVEIGQKVNIRFKNFPDNEFGIVRGYVKNISLVPSKDNEITSYTIDISLPDGLITTYRKELPYLPEMEGSAEIITNDISLFERFVMPIKKMLSESL